MASGFSAWQHLGTPRFCGVQVDTVTRDMHPQFDTPPPGNRLLTDHEACEYLRIHNRQLYAWRMNGAVPFIRIGRSVRYRLCDLEAAIEAQRVVMAAPAKRPSTNRPAPAAQPSQSPAPEFAALFTPNPNSEPSQLQ